MDRLAQLTEIIERAMTAHWDFRSCNCGLCEAGHALGLAARDNYLHAKDIYYMDYLSSEAGDKRAARAQLEQSP